AVRDREPRRHSAWRRAHARRRTRCAPNPLRTRPAPGPSSARPPARHCLRREGPSFVWPSSPLGFPLANPSMACLLTTPGPGYICGVSSPDELIDLGDRRLRVRRLAPGQSDGLDRTTLVFLHEGLGCIEMWRDFPQNLCDATRCPGVVYDRTGYGGSSP